MRIFGKSTSQRALLAAAVLGPALLFGAMAWWSHERLNREAAEDITRTVDLLYEHATKLLQVDELLLSRIDDKLAFLDWSEVDRRAPELAHFVQSILPEIEGVDAAFILDGAGTIRVAAGRAGTSPPTMIEAAMRRYFREAQQSQKMFLDGPFVEPGGGEPVIEAARPLTSADGSLRGFAVLAISRASLSNSWKSLVSEGDTISLVRDDGVVLARYPEVPMASSGSPATFSDAAMAQMRGADSGVIGTVSKIDSIARLDGFRRLPGYKIDIVYAVDRRNIAQQWYPTLVAFGGLSAAAAAALLLIALAVIRRGRGEAAALAKAEAAAAALRESEELHRARYDRTPAPLHAFDAEARLIAVSERWLELLGYRREEVLGRPLSDFMTPESARNVTGQAWRRFLESGHLRDVERQYVRKNGEVLDVLLSSRVERDLEGRFLRGLTVLTDVTHSKRIAAALQQSQKMEAVGQLTGGIAHDFNNLLTVIIGNLERLQARTAELDDAMRNGFAATMRAATRAATLTQRLLAFARQQPLSPKSVDPNRLVAGMSELLRRTLGERIAIETVLAGGLWWVSVDPNQLESALLNLAVNARDAMPNGGKLTIETANTYLDEAYAAANQDVTSGQYTMLSVSDTGTGMSAETIAKAFEPFFTTKEVGQGTGLGLSQVYGFVKQSGGHIKIYSELGVGSSVKLYLPRLPVPIGPDRRAPQAVPPAKGARDETLLVVEDDAEVRAYCVGLLRDLGYAVLEARDGPSALHQLEEEPAIRLMFTDVGLPGGLNGRQLADEARRRRPELKVLFTTGYARNAIIHDGRLDPDVELVAKPFTYESLAGQIRKALDGGRVVSL